MTAGDPGRSALLIFDRELLDERRYWLERLDAPGERAALVPDGVAATGVPPVAQASAVRLEGDGYRRLGRLTRGSPFLTYAALVATAQVLLYKASGCRQAVVGSPARADHPRPNVLAITGRVEPGASFRDHLERAAGALEEAYRRQRYPHERLVRDLGLAGDGERCPLFDLLIALGTLHGPVPDLSPRPDLSLILDDDGRGLTGHLRYRPDRFRESTAVGLTVRLWALLSAGLLDPRRPVAELSALSDEERRERLVAWTATAAPVPGGPGVHALVEAQADRSPDAVAVSMVADGGAIEQLSYRALDARANRLAHLLREAGVGPERLVGLCLPRSTDLVAALLAVLKAGGAYLPLDPDYPRERLAFMLADAGVQTLVTVQGLRDRLPGEATVILLDGDREQARLRATPTERPPAAGTATQLAYVIYTSGSTGAPKGVAVPHQGVTNLVAAQIEAFGITPTSRVAQLASLSFDASVSEILTALGAGAQLWLGTERGLLPGPELLRFVASQAITHATIPPSALAVLDVVPLPALTTLVVAGEACPPALAARWVTGRWMCNAYGPTEVTVCATITRVDRDRRPHSVGGPIANTRIYVLDADGTPCPADVPGELWVGGVGVTRGYLGRPGLTAERFRPDPFAAVAGQAGGSRLYRTGDRAAYLPDGAVTFLGRMDDQVKVRGYRIEPGEIESILAEHPAVGQAAVVAREDRPGDVRLAAYVAGRPGAPRPGVRALRAFLRERLPDYMVPAAIVILDALPTGPTGKLDRRALPAPDRARPDGDGPSRASRTPTEEILAGLWEALLGLDGVGPDDDFFQLGGHSLLATQLVSRVREALGVETLAVRDVFETPTLGGLARRLDEARRGAAGSPGLPVEAGHRPDPLPLSFAQQRLWVLEQLEGATSAYNLPVALALDGSLDRRALDRALGEILRRHEVLRTRLDTVEGVPVQVIDPPPAFHLPYVELGGLPGPAREATLRARVAAEAARPFDLGAGPLVRGILFGLGPRRHALLLTLHHVVTDGWSMGLLVEELSTVYEAFAAGRASPLPDPPLQYADYAVWQRGWLTDERLAPDLAYWRQKLGSAPALLPLPTDRPRPAAQSFRGATLTFSLPADLVGSLRELGRQAGATLFMTLLSGFAALLHRYTGETDLVVGTDVANRTLTRTEGLMGFLVNQLALRVDLGGRPSFRELLGRVRETCLDAYAHQEVPFQRLLDALALERDLSRAPLFQVKFLLQNVPAGRLELPGLTVSEVPVPADTTTFDLVLAVTEGPGALQGFVTYRTELFDEATIGRLLAHWQRILRSGVADPAVPVDTIVLLGDAERRDTLAAGRGRETAAPAGSGVHRLVEAQAARTPDRVAVRTGDHEVTYGALDARAAVLAGRLRAMGVGPDVTVAVFAERSLALVAALLAVLRAGGAYLPLDPEQPLERLAAMVEDARPAVVLTQGALEDRLPAAIWAPVLDLDDPDTWSGAPAPSVAVDPEHLAYVIYTSGSTGRPKAVMVPHRGLAGLIAWHQRAYAVGPADRATQLAGLGFDASVWELWPHLAVGASVTLGEPDLTLAPVELRDWLVRQQATVSFLPTPLAEAVLPLAWPDRPALRLLLTGGDRLHAYPRPGLPFEVANNYGPTELTVVTTWAPLPRVGPTGAGATPPPIGRPVDGARAHVVDAHLQPVPPGIPGELLGGGRPLARGYLGRPALTAERFVPDSLSGETGARLYRTGDLVRAGPDGRLEYLGRRDSQVSLRGFRIELGEIESVLGRHPAVDHAAALLVNGSGAEERVLVAYVVPRDGTTLEPAALRQFLATRLPAYMVPSALVPMAALPLTPSGKLDRRALPAPARSDDRGAIEDPRNEREAVLARVWGEVLRRERVGIHDNFFELGGDSILSIQVVARAARDGLRLTARQMFQHQTIAELAAVAGGIPAVSADQGEVAGPAPLTPIQHWFFEQPWRFRAHYTQSMLLTAPPDLDGDRLREAFGHLLAHHDALRLRFEPTPDGWRQAHASPGGPVPFERIDLSGDPPEEREALLADHLARVQASLDPTTGPLARLVHLHHGPGAPGRLLLVVHHLAVDTVSWPILLADLGSVYGQLQRGEPVELPAKTTAFRDWARHLTAHVSRDGLAEAAAFWREALAVEVPSLPVRPGAQRERDTVGAARTVTVALGPEETSALLAGRAGSAGGRIDDVLLAALLLAVHQWTGQQRLAVDLEAHGREPLSEGLDVSRTVGWFTALYPVVLALPEGGAPLSPGDTLAAVSARLAAARRWGIHHGLLRYLHPDPAVREALATVPRPEVSFNYLGRLDAVVPGDGPFGPAPEPPGPGQDPREQRAYLLEVGAAIAGGRLHVDWRYGPSQHRHADVERLAQAFLASLRTLVRSPGGAGPRPPATAFPLARLDPDTLVRLLDEVPDLEDVYPLSPMQQGLLYHTLLEPEAHVLFEQVEISLEGDLDAEAFRGAWQAVVDRHPVWRTAIRWADLPEPHQVVQRRASLDWETLDWRDGAGDEPEVRLARFLAEDRARGLPLHRAPLMRGTLIRVGDRRWRFVFTHHHLMMDGWCLPVLLGEAFALHEARRAGRPSPLPPVRPYRDFIAWLARQDRGDAERYWRGRLEGLREPTSLRVPRPAAPEGPARYARVERVLSPGLTARLRALARTRRLTPSVLVQGAWAVLLARYSGRTDVVFGVTGAGRPPDLPGVEGIVGLFLTTVPVRVRVPDDASLFPWLAALLRDQFEREAFAHAPLVDIQGWSEVPRGQPLFESLVVFENYPVDASLQAVTGIRITGLSAEERVGTPLTLVAGGSDELTLGLVHDTARFGARIVGGMLAHLEVLLQAFADAADRPEGSRLGDLPLLADEDHRRLRGWNDTTRPYPSHQTIHGLFEEWADRTPDAAALVADHDGQPLTLTYAVLNARANHLAGRLRASGVGPDVPVAVLLPRSPRLVETLLAVLKAGGAFVPLDVEYPMERLRFMLEDSGAPVIVTDDPAGGHLPTEGSGRLVLAPDPVEPTGGRWPNPAVRVSPDNLAYVTYTSGSTGRPKGADVTHRNVVRLTTAPGDAAFGPGDTGVLLASVSFDASTLEVWGPLTSGARLAVFPPALPSLGDLAEFIERHQPTTLWLTAGLFARMVDHQAAALGRLRTLLAGGDVLPPRQVQALLARGEPLTLVNGYGPSENTVFTTCHRLGPRVDPGRAGAGHEDVPIGRPIPNTRAHVLDARSRLVPVELPGELCAGGDGVARGYHRQPGLTAERFVPDPHGGQAGARLYRTGDEVRWRADGVLQFLGRLDRQVKIRGFRVEPAEVEAALTAHPAVREAAVIAREDTGGTRWLAGYVVASRDGARAGLVGELRRHLRARLPDHLVPATLTVLDALPLSPNGKVDRDALPDPADPAARVGPVAPRDGVELELRHLWEEVLGRRGIGTGDNFFHLGGHSLTAISLVARIEQRFGRRVPVAAVLERPTIALLAELIREPGPGRAPRPLVALQPRGGRRPLFCVHPGGGTAFCYLPLAHHLGQDQPLYGLQAPGLGGECEPLTSVEEMAALYLDAVRSVQPEGPYQLAGWSTGGLIAFEVARRARQAGLPVTALLLLDAPARITLPQGLDDGTLLRELAREAGIKGAVADPGGPESSDGLLDLARALGLVPDGAGAEHLARILRVYRANLAAAAAHHPSPGPGPATLLRFALPGEPPPVDPSLGWAAVVGDGLEIEVLDGDHFAPVRDGAVEAVARAVARRLG